MPGNSLSLYVHIPWCVRKCPYCDFNSHEHSKGPAGDTGLPEKEYLQALVDDLQNELGNIEDSSNDYGALQSIFFGGGTPSLLSGNFYQSLLGFIDDRIGIAGNAEITLEANPGTVDEQNFRDYRRAGINRLSLGVQSFNDPSLKALGRIHSADAARQAFATAREAGFDNINIDLMHGLPEQLPAQAMGDLSSAFALSPEHISWYQLTIEPNTVFYSSTPVLPDEESLGSIFDQGLRLLEQAGYRQYEVSAFAKAGKQSQHNLNYWQFGDYIGIGAGAHGKVCVKGNASGNKKVVRRWKTRMPADYMKNSDKLAGEKAIAQDEVAVEFLMNALRLRQGFTVDQFEAQTGLAFQSIEATVVTLQQRGLLEYKKTRVCASSRGYLFLNDVIAAFQG